MSAQKPEVRGKQWLSIQRELELHLLLLFLSPGGCGAVNDMQLGADGVIARRHLIILKQIRD